MLKRIITGLLAGAVLVLVLLTYSIWLTIGIAVMTMIAMWEFYRAVGLTTKNKPLCIIGIIGSCLIIGTRLVEPEPRYIALVGFVYIVSLLLIMLYSREYVTLTDVAMIIIGNLYVAYLMLHIILVRSMTVELEYEIIDVGQMFIWLVFVGAIATDTFAYFTGFFFGKRKLWPDVSPKKTVEGAIGGTLGCGGSFVVYGLILEYLLPQFEVSLLLMFMLGLLCALAAQLGDLVASVIKRQYGVKDFGKILPGHGGVLDRFDSILFVAPVVYLFILHIGVIIA